MDWSLLFACLLPVYPPIRLFICLLLQVRDLVRDVALHFVLPRTSVTPLLSQGVLSAQEVRLKYEGLPWTKMHRPRLPRYLYAPFHAMFAGCLCLCGLEVRVPLPVSLQQRTAHAAGVWGSVNVCTLYTCCLARRAV